VNDESDKNCDHEKCNWVNLSGLPKKSNPEQKYRVEI
jgi:hypothetical protein